MTRSLHEGTRSARELVAELVGELGAPPDLVVISGGLAERAIPAEYQVAHQFLSTLRDALSLDHQRVVIVPGEGDVNRPRCKIYFDGCEADGKEPVPPYWEKWRPFSTMLNRFHGAELPKDQPWSLTEYPDLRVVVAGLNSTMALTHLPDGRHGELGEDQLAWFAEQLEQTQRRDWLRIGVLHHRPSGDGAIADADRFAQVLDPHLDLVLHGRTGGAEWQLVEVYPDRVLVRPGDGEPIPLRHRRAVPRQRPPEPDPEPEPALLRFGRRVAEVCRLRYPDAEVVLVPRPDSGRLAYLRVSPDRTRGDRGPAEQYPVGVCLGVPAEDDVDWFTGVLDRFRTGDSERTDQMVFEGGAVDPQLMMSAGGRGAELVTFADFQVGPDLATFARNQAAELDADPVYRSETYVPQRYTEFRSGPGVPSEVPPATDLLAWLSGWADAPRGRLVVVLGTFGHGKTFLLRELARRMTRAGSPTVPILIDLRGFEKAYSLDELVAVQVLRQGQRQVDLDVFRYLRREGRVALLFDGFDELATRVSYDRATNHLDTIVQAAEEQAKVILTSRDQHFLTDADVLAALGAQLGAERQVVRLADFDDQQIVAFLTHHLHDPLGAQARFALLRQVKDLLGLSRNPRMLGFITELGDDLTDAVGSPITAAALYREVIGKWLAHEARRLQRLGPDAPTRADLQDAVTHLALRLWDSPDDSLTLDDLGDAAATLSRLTTTGVSDTAALEPQESAHVLGSSTLLMRSGDQRFTFVHHSVREWLIANHLAAHLPGNAAAPGLVGRSMSPLIIEFLCGIAGREPMREWAAGVLDSSPPPHGAARNAREILHYLRVDIANMARADLRGKDYSGHFLGGTDFSEADLTDARLVESDLTGATLANATLIGARLDRAVLRGADATGADLSGARLLGADLTGTVLTGARLRRAALVAAKGTTGEGLRAADTLGAALPGEEPPEPQIVSSAVVNAVAVVSGARLLAGAGADGVIRVWDALNGTPLRALTGHTEPLRAIAYSDDGRFLASAGTDETVRVWDAGTGRPVHTLSGHTGWVRALAYSPDGRFLASAGDDETVRIWDTASGRTVRTLEGHVGRVQALAYHPRGDHLASSSDDETIRVWNTATGDTEHVLTGHTGTVQAIAYAGDGERLASASDDRLVLVWDMATGLIVHTLTGHTQWVRSVAFHPEGRQLASAGDDGTIRIWDSVAGQALYTLTGHEAAVHSLAYYQDGRHLASAGDDRTVRIWDTTGHQQPRTLRADTGDSRAVCFPRGMRDAWLAVGSGDGSVRLWSREAGTPPRVLHPPGSSGRPITAVAATDDGGRLATAAEDGQIRIWDTVTGKGEPLPTGHRGVVRALAFGPDGRYLVSAGGDGVVRLWDVKGKEQPRTLATQRGSVDAVAFTPDGAFVAAGGQDGTIRAWRLDDGKRAWGLAHANAVRAIAFSPDGRQVASADQDGMIMLRTTGEPDSVLPGHTGAVTTIAYSPGGGQLASGGADGTVRIWDTAGGRPIRTLTGDGSWIRSLSYAPDGGRLAGAGGDRGVRLWDPALAAPPAILVPLADGGAAVLLRDRRYILQGQQQGEFWYATSMCRFEPGELDQYVPGLNRVPPGEPLW